MSSTVINLIPVRLITFSKEPKARLIITQTLYKVAVPGVWVVINYMLHQFISFGTDNQFKKNTQKWLVLKILG